MKYPAIQNFINGQFTPANTSRMLDVISPVDGTHLATVPMSTSRDLDAAVRAAKSVFPAWSRMPIKERVQVFFKYKYLLEQHLRDLAQLVSEENGKTLAEGIEENKKCI